MSENTKKNILHMEEAAHAMRRLGERYAKQVLGTKEAPSSGNVDEDTIYAFTNLHSNVISGYDKIEKLHLLAEKNEIDKDGIAANREFLMSLHEEDNKRSLHAPVVPEFVQDESFELTEGEVLAGSDSEDLEAFRERRNQSK